MATEAIEIERKYEVDDDTLVPDLAELPGVAALGDVRTHHLVADYLDTADYRLAQAKVTLRRRTGGSDDGWHLKRPLPDGTRQEVHAPISADEPADLPSAVPASLLTEVADLAGGDGLTVVATLRNRRAEQDLLAPDGSVHAVFCDDRVHATAYGPDGERDTRWREWELELVVTDEQSGLHELRACDELLAAAGARPASSASKLARAIGR